MFIFIQQQLKSAKIRRKNVSTDCYRRNEKWQGAGQCFQVSVLGWQIISKRECLFKCRSFASLQLRSVQVCKHNALGGNASVTDLMEVGVAAYQSGEGKKDILKQFRVCHSAAKWIIHKEEKKKHTEENSRQLPVNWQLLDHDCIAMVQQCNCLSKKLK